MKIFIVLMCSLALVCVAYAQPEEGKPQKKKQGQTAQHGPPPTGHPTGAGAGGKKISVGPYQVKGNKGQTSMGPYQGHKGNKGQTSGGGYEGQKGKTSTGAYEGQTGKAKGGKVTAAGKPGEVTTGKATAKGKPFKPQHFNLPTKTTPTKVTAVNFQQGRHIQGSQNWQGTRYTVFRNYSSQWHDRNWWSGHYNRVVFVYGGWYAWNAGYWIPAWGYAPNAYYAFDGPIYGYNGLPPDQVIANVQTALQQQGYYQGEVDGLLGPQTRAAIADYQRANGLPETASVDQPTLESLGMS